MFIQSAGVITELDQRWAPGGVYSSLRFYNATSYDYATLYRTQPNVRTCVDFLARNIAHLGLHVFRRIGETDRERLRDHPLAVILAQPLPPWAKVTRYRLIHDLVADLGVYWNAFWLKTRMGKPGLMRLPPERMSVHGTLIPEYYNLDVSGTPKRLECDELVHFRGYNAANPVWGLSPLETLRRVLAEEHAAGDYRENFWANAARMGGVIERPGAPAAPEWSPQARERFKQEFEQLYSGAANSGKTAVLEEGMTWKPMVFNAQESEYLAGRKLTREECARAYHIPLPMVGILDHATFCLPGYVPVFTAQGPRPISDVKAGDHVWSLGEEGFSLKRVLHSGQTGVDPILRIKTQNRTLDCNCTHPILVRRLFKVSGIADEAADVKKRAGQSRWHYEEQHVYVPASEIRRGDVLVTAFHLGGTGSDRQSLARMEFFGLYVGDGNLTRNGGKPSGVAISRSEQALYMDHYRRVMSEFTGRSGHRVGLDEQPRQTRMCSVEAARLMVTLGFSGTAHEKRVPGWVFESSFEARLAFLRGYLDADGSVDKKGRISYSSCNRELIEDVRHLCMSVGVPVNNIYNFRGKTTLPNGRVADVCSWTITCADPGANRLIGSNDPRYLLRLAGGKPFGRKSNKYPFAKGRRSSPPMGCSYSRVVSIEQLPEQPVFDLGVEDTHNFVAAGVVVHNSNIREQHKNLYQDCLGPWLAMIEQEIELQLLPDLGETEGVYCEFNIQEKLSGSFEEKAASYQTAVGRPYMTVNEVRARENLPSLAGDADDLVTPLNMMTSSQAEAQAAEPEPAPEPAPVVEPPTEEVAPAQASKAAKDMASKAKVDPTLPRTRARHREQWALVYARHFSRQRDAVLSKLPKGRKLSVGEIWEAERWNKELRTDVKKLSKATATVWARYVAEQMAAEFDEGTIEEYLDEHARIVAENINATTADGIAKALKGGSILDDVRHLFEVAIAVRAVQAAATSVTSMANFGSESGARAGGIKTKTWQVNSANPRAEHAAMNGETVDIGDLFSNGALWPGDPVLGAEGNSNCACSVVFGR